MTTDLSDLKVALKKQGLHYRLEGRDVDGTFGEILHFLDVHKGVRVSGKIITNFTEGEVYHWPLLSHENLAPLIEVVFIHEHLTVFITIDRRTTLRDYIHDEDFIHDPRCFERKKTYARGILRGLAYLHGKSLCLMNLSDNNIVICKSTDQAIISDLSCLTCSRRTTKSKLRVPKLYKAPESDKGEFDATAAEIWAAGTLMLDVFLAHMVPWAIVDHIPSKVIKLIDKLFYELFEAANIGSVTFTTDFERFKIFIKCFFKTNPKARVTATNASIASFLSKKVNENTYGFNAFEKSKYLNENFITKIGKQRHSLDSLASRASSSNLLPVAAVHKIPSTNASNGQIPLDSKHSETESKQLMPVVENKVPSVDKHPGLSDSKPVMRETLANFDNIRGNTEDRVKNTKEVHNFYLYNSYSYCRAINPEYSFARNLESKMASNINVQKEKSAFSEKLESKEKMIGENINTERAIKKKERNASKSRNVRKKSINSTRSGGKQTTSEGNGIRSEAISKRKGNHGKPPKSKYRPKRKDTRRTFMLGLCPGGTIEEPSLIPEHMCERCRLLFVDES